MGTRADIIFQADGEDIAVLYCQSDGYPDGVGASLVNILKGREVVNGFSDQRQINGPQDMAVQVITCLKLSSALSRAAGQRLMSSLDDEEGLKGWFARQEPKTKDLDPALLIGPGQFYLYPPSKDLEGWEWLYVLNCPLPKDGDDFSWRGRIHLTVKGCYQEKPVYEGFLDDFDPRALTEDS